MGNIGPAQLVLIALIILLIFGAGRIAEIGKGLGAGIKNFKKGLSDDEDGSDKQLAEGSKSEDPDKDSEKET